VKPRKLPAEDTVSSLKTESIKESALNSKEVVWSGVLGVIRLASLAGRMKSGKKGMQEFWEVGIL